MNSKRLASHLSRGLLAVGIGFLGVRFLWADAGPAELARLVRVFIFRPGVFADQPFGLGIPSNTAAIDGHLWYVRIDPSIHARAGIETLSEFLLGTGVPGVDFSQDSYVSNTDIERLKLDYSPLRLFRFAGTQLTDEVMPTVGNLYDLQVLETSSRVTDRGLAFLKNLKQLRVLTVNGAGVTDASVAVIAALPHLERLNLQGTKITDAGLARLAGLHLRELDLSSDITDHGLEPLRAMAALEQVDLSQASVGAAGLRALSSLSKIHTLFLGPSVTDADLSALLVFKNLKRLDLSGARITDASGDVLAQMTQLEELALSGTPVTKATLEKLRRLPKLRYLEVSQTHIQPEDWKSFSPLPAVQVLSFSSPRRLATKDLRIFGSWPKLHSVLVNGALLSPSMIDYLRNNRQSKLWSLVVVAEAEEASGVDVEQVLAAATDPAHTDRPAFEGFHGLKRVHEAEASLEDVTMAPSNPQADTFQENEKNFLGEITVNSAPSKKN